ncbi:MAG: hypothetical protein JOZ73_00270 [Solirubrobacterales bacterium]|nr:hypothetical protein [Solirubrobacterales bacterium]
MSFLDRAKAAAEQAAGKVQAGVEDAQAKRDLTQVYGDLGRTAYSLVSRGEISHPELNPLVQRVTELEGSGGAGAPAAGGAPAGEPAGGAGGGPTPSP